MDLVEQRVDEADGHLDFLGSGHHAHAHPEFWAQSLAQEFQELYKVGTVLLACSVARQAVVHAVVGQVLPVQGHAVEETWPPLEDRQNGGGHGFPRRIGGHGIAELAAPRPPAHRQGTVEFLARLHKFIELAQVPEVRGRGRVCVLWRHTGADVWIVVVGPCVAGRHRAV